LKTLAVIPARYLSTRFPGKPLALIANKPMIQWVYERVSQVRTFDEVIVATDSPDIVAVITGIGGKASLTHSDHLSGTDRVWEIAEKIPEAPYVFNVQGDEPMIDPLHLEEASRLLENHHDSIDIVTLKAPIVSVEAFKDPNVVKVVTDTKGKALYFSRSPIPHGGVGYRHIGVYGYRREALSRFVSLPVSPLETTEKLEQLRALEAGMHLHVMEVEKAPIGVDTPEDLQHVQALLLQMEDAECRL